jgi:hypothetical protein
VESEDARRLATEHALSVQEVDRIAHRSLSE